MVYGFRGLEWAGGRGAPEGGRQEHRYSGGRGAPEGGQQEHRYSGGARLRLRSKLHREKVEPNLSITLKRFMVLGVK